MTEDADTKAAWVAADWGTSHLRLWPMAADNRPLCRIDSDRGMGTLERQGFEAALIPLLEPYLSPDRVLDVLCCGMAGSRQGWIEAPYAETPCPPPSFAQATRAPCGDSRLAVHILPGVKQMEPADVMRGEETQIAGALALKPQLDGVICLPGTHTKWVSVQAGEIQRFATFLTGELFQLLSKHSVLRHSLAPKGWDRATFEASCLDVIERPHAFANMLFSLRAEGLLKDLDPVIARSRASGYVLGMEIEAMRAQWQDRSVVIVGEDEIAGAYAAALGTQGVVAQVMDAEAVTLAGLCAARKQM
ncbi:2-dehydro-3-deoxygalactonokinase [Phaeobacter sp. HF9A]|uniref:2-dehydro-3-deoxygalactonokinase n=1 Tax=Phaeobacter sp. HF9A TaxID=2721561 RepID=UPI0014321DDC|nr:2-dehydro-3-deoxygalactonokinase [Phaeobacter sp. HF9A]NIZ11873.1 2-dehydro-3-deoxygalactonokinase [Phaeobacter sp. HF9A]